MTLIEHAPAESPFERELLPEPFVYPPAPANTPQPLTQPLHPYYSLAWASGTTTTPSTLLQGLTIAATLGVLIEIGTALLAALGLGWLLRRTIHT